METEYNLRNVEEAAGEHPDTFKIPSREERLHVGIGDFCKLHFCSDAGQEQERMWVKVYGIELAPSGEAIEYSGRLDNTPREISLQIGAEILFGPEHISDIIRGERPSEYIEFELGVMKPGEKFEEYRELKDILNDRKQSV